jgi:hypothetical protein
MWASEWSPAYRLHSHRSRPDGSVVLPVLAPLPGWSSPPGRTWSRRFCPYPLTAGTGPTSQRDGQPPDRRRHSQGAPGIPQRQLRDLLPERALWAPRHRARQATDMQLHRHASARYGKIDQPPQVPGMHPPRCTSAARTHRLGHGRSGTQPPGRVQVAVEDQDAGAGVAAAQPDGAAGCCAAR